MNTAIQDGVETLEDSTQITASINENQQGVKTLENIAQMTDSLSNEEDELAVSFKVEMPKSRSSQRK